MINTRMLVSPASRLRTLDRVLGQALSDTGGHVWVPAMDVAEKRDAYLVTVELPGVDPEQVDVHFDQNVLRVSGTKPSSFDANNAQEIRVFTAERANGDFSRSVRLPDGTDAEAINATFVNGLLTVTLPKAKTAQPRKIAISFRAEQQASTNN